VRAFLNTIRGRLVLLVLLVLVPVLVLQVYGAWRDLRGDIEVRKLDSVRAIAHATGDFETLLADARGVFADLVRANELRSPANCTQIFTALRFAYERLAPYATNVGLADADGNIYCAVNPVQVERNLASRPEFRAAISSLDMAVGSYGLNPQTGAPQVTITYPVLSFDGRLHTVIFATLTAGWLENWQRESALPAGSAVTVLGTDSQILWRAVDSVPIMPRGLQSEAASWLAQVWAGGPPSEGVDLDGVRRLNVVAPLRLKGQAAGFLHLGYPVEQLYAQAYRNVAWDLALLAGVLLLALALAWQGSERLFLHPLRNLMAAVQRLQGGDLGARVSSVRGLGEVAALGQAFDRMADTLQQREIERMQLEQRFRAAFESSAIGMGLLTLDGWILAANAAVCQMSGYTEEELKHRNDSENVYPPDAQVGLDLFEEMLAGQRGYYSVEKRYIRKNGAVFWLRLTLSLVRDARGEPAYLVSMIEDIDEQKRKSAALAESEARFRAMFENSAVGMGLMSLDRVLLDANPAICAMYGYTRDELVGNTPAIVTYPEDYPVSTDQFRQLLSSEINSYISERRYVRKNGEVFWAQISMSLVRDPDGKPLYLVGLVNDIDGQKRRETELAESEARFRTLYDSAEMGIVLVDLGSNGNLPLDEARFNHLVASQRLNPAMLRMFGYTAEELQNITIASLIYPEDRGIDAQPFRQILTGEIDSFRFEKRFVRKDGSVFWGRLTDSLARSADGAPQMVIGIIEDINEERQAKERLAVQEAEHRRQLEQRIAERTAELNEANERLREKAAQDAVAAERSRLARDLHDAVTQTLFSTTLIADVLPDLWVMSPSDGQRRLEELRQLTRGALAEMRTLLVELRPNALTDIPLSTLLRQLTEAMISRSRIAIQLSIEGDLPAGRKLPGDVQVGLYRIAQETLNNIAKHAKATQAMISLRLGETVRLTVADNGVGFDPGAITADHLGLRIMRERAEAIGARFSVYSEPGEGTQVSVVWSGERSA
jgi:PAS domain S-box-containing protein